MSLSFLLITRFDDLVLIRDEWSRLLARSGNPEPTMSPEWLLRWWHIFGRDGDRELRTCLFFDRDRLVGLAPLLARTYWYRPGIPFRRLELLGVGEDEADEVTSEYVGIIAEHKREWDVAGALSRVVREGRLGEWNEIVFHRMNGDARMTPVLATQLARHGLRLDLADSSVSFYAPLPARWEDYLGKLSSSRRYRIKRALRDFDRWSGGDYALHRANCDESLRRGRDILIELHTERWRAQGSPGIFASDRFRRFHDDLLPELLRSGSIDLLWLEARGEPIAALYNLVWDGRVHFYQSGRRMDLPRHLKPGIVIHTLAIERAIREGRREYDFLAGNARYKSELALARRRLVSLRATPIMSPREGARRVVQTSLRRARDAVLRRRPEPEGVR